MLRCCTFLAALVLLGPTYDVLAQPESAAETRVVVESQGWHLVGDLLIPETEVPAPAVLLLHQAAGNRTVFRDLAHHLAARGVASLRLDLRGHGESINLGRFVPGQQPRSPLIWDAEPDVTAAHEFLKAHAHIDAGYIGIVGASYSGEEMAEAGRLHGFGQAYVALSPGSFSEESIAGIDSSGVPWLFVASNNERYLQEITAAVQAQSTTVELLVVPGTAHATNILQAHPEMAERLAVWLAAKLR